LAGGAVQWLQARGSARRGLRVVGVIAIRRPLWPRRVAQPGRAPRSGRGGRRFESSLSDQPSLRSSEGCRAEARKREGGLRPGSRSYGSASQPSFAKRDKTIWPWCNKPGGHMVYVYILQSILNTDHFYIGACDDLKSRLKEHNAGEVFHTAKFKPWILKNYFAFLDRKKAYAFEKYLKSGSGRTFAKRHF
jgi:putative endonuclease